MSHAEFARVLGLTESHASYLLNGHILHPRRSTRDKLRQYLEDVSNMTTDQVNEIVPDVAAEPESQFVFWIKGDLRDTRRKVRVAAALHDSTSKQYVVDLFDEAQPDPLSVIRAAQAQADAEEVDLEEWAKARLKT